MTQTWDSWRFLLGKWVGKGSGEPGQGEGGSSFEFDLDQKILVRKNAAYYLPSGDQPAVSHADLMIIYPEAAGAFRAIYFDNEGHVIHYTAGFSANGDTLSFISDPGSSSPRFRLSYVKNPEKTLTVRFEVAPPGQPEAFSMYTEGIIFPRRE
jgi:hypothetical protein